ncbi:MAG: DUF433 domain-containing protein [Methylacidiphilales bacterium]|nr:DUF433 domain-containing protein [Candidatus Methylacidiphilales bacterium]
MKTVKAAYPHIVKSSGKPARLEKHSRTRVAMLAADYLWRGWSAEEIARHYPYLTLGEVHAALGYYFDHREEIDSELLEESRHADAWRKAHPTASELVRLKVVAT